jgi:hypothetical protein
MTVPFESIQGFAGPAGVGVLCLVAIFFIVSAFADNLPSKLKQTAPSWGAVATVPVLLVGYVLGLLAITVVLRPSSADVLALAGAADSPAVSQYLKTMNEAEVLGGSVLAFILLALGAGAATISLDGWRRTLGTAAAVSLLLAFGSWRVSTYKLEDARRLAAALENSSIREQEHK